MQKKKRRKGKITFCLVGYLRKTFRLVCCLWEKNFCLVCCLWGKNLLFTVCAKIGVWVAVCAKIGVWLVVCAKIDVWLAVCAKIGVWLAVCAKIGVCDGCCRLWTKVSLWELVSVNLGHKIGLMVDEWWCRDVGYFVMDLCVLLLQGSSWTCLCAVKLCFFAGFGVEFSVPLCACVFSGVFVFCFLVFL